MKLNLTACAGLAVISLATGGCGGGQSPSLPSPETWKADNHAGLQALREGRKEDAERALKSALVAAESFGDADPRLAATLNNLASVYDAEGRLADAEVMYERAANVFARAGGKASGLFVILTNLARVEDAQKKYDDAAATAKRLLLVRESDPRASKAERADTMVALAEAYAKAEHYALAEPLFRRALAVDIDARGRKDPVSLDHLERYAELLRKIHRTADADKLEQLARSIREEK